MSQVQKGLPAAWRRSCHRSAHQQLCTLHSAAAQRQKIQVTDSHNLILESPVSYHLNWFLSFWCLTCDAVPEPSCHNSHHIVLDMSEDVDELCALLLVVATFSSDIVTLRRSNTNRTSNWNLKDCRKRWRQSSCWWQRTAAAWTNKCDWWWRRIGLQSKASPY